MKKRKGFTLAELLVVLVILGILITLSTPAVVKIMNNATEKTFYEYAQSVIAKTNKKVVTDLTDDTKCYAYDITNDLGMENTGDFKGYILYEASTETYHLTLYDKNYMLINYTFTAEGSNNQTAETIKANTVSYSSQKAKAIQDKIDESAATESSDKIIYLFGLTASC